VTGAAVRGLRNPFRSCLRAGVVVVLLALVTGFLALMVQVTIKVPKGTQIKQGESHLFLPGTKGRVVAITDVEDKGEKVAKSIEVKDAKR
jgi:hypothetical protein